MAVRRHGDKWRADWRDEHGIRRRKDFDLKANALNHEHTMLQAAKDGETGGAPACDPDVLLNEYAKRFLANREALGIDPATVHRQECDLRRHVLPRFGLVKVREIFKPAVRSFLLSKLGEAKGLRDGDTRRKPHKRLARGSVRCIFHSLSAVLTEAVSENLIKAHPLRGLWRELSKGQKKTDERVKVKALDPQQATAFLAAAEKHASEHYPYFCTLMLAGLRPGEGLAVTADRVDLRGRTLLVDRQIGQHDGLKRTKTGKERSVELSVHLAGILGSLIDARKGPTSKVVPITGTTPADDEAGSLGPWLFYPDLGTTPAGKDAQRTYKRAINGMRRALKAAGLPQYFGLHSLRHTFGSGLISAGHSPAFVKQQMGHESVEMTVGVYGSWFPVRVPGAMDALAEKYALGRGHQMDTKEILERVKGS